MVGSGCCIRTEAPRSVLVETTDDRRPQGPYGHLMGASDSTLPRHVTLADGDRIVLRDVRDGDEPVLRRMLGHVTGDSRWMRFFCGGADLESAVSLEALADGVRALGVLAFDEDDRILGHGMCVPAGDDVAEVAFEVVDGQHRRGIGGVLLAELVRRARTAGYRTLVAEVLPVNRDMLDMLAASGLPITKAQRDGVVHVRIPLQPSSDPDPDPEACSGEATRV